MVGENWMVFSNSCKWEDKKAVPKQMAQPFQLLQALIALT